MKPAKFHSMLHKLELQMRRAELHGDALLVAHYQQLIEDLIYAQSDDPPKISGDAESAK